MQHASAGNASASHRLAITASTYTAGPVAEVPGLWVFPGVLPDEVVHAALAAIAEDDLFSGGKRDQVMLFDRYSSQTDDLKAADEEYDPILDDTGDGSPDSRAGDVDARQSDLPIYLRGLLSATQTLVSPYLPANDRDVVFAQPLARQVIINLYPPGQGISPHIDLPHRYADGILGISLCGSCTMTLTHSDGRERHVWLRSNSVYCLTGEARWHWAHGIAERRVDTVHDEKGRQRSVMRDLRVSVTYRWVKEGAMELVEFAGDEGQR